MRGLVACSIVALFAANPVHRAAAQSDTVWITPQKGSCDDVANKASPMAGNEQNFPTTGFEASLGRVARLAPGGLGAVFLRGSKTVITLVDTSKSEDAIDLISGFPGMPSISRNSLKVEVANWTFLDLLDWFPFVVSQTDSAAVAESVIDQVGNRILITAVDKKKRDLVVTSLRALLLPCQLVAVAVATPAPQGSPVQRPPGHRREPRAGRWMVEPR